MGGAVQGAVEAVEAALSRRRVLQVADPPAIDLAGDEVAAHVPLAGHAGAVAGLAQHLGDGGAVVAQKALVGGGAGVDPHMPDARVVRVEPGEQRRAGRAAAGAVVHGRQQRAVLGQGVDVGRADLGPGTAEVGKPHVVAENQNDVGTGHGASRVVLLIGPFLTSKPADC